MNELGDFCTMPFGKFKGEFMSQVPAKYLLWLHDKMNEKDKHRNYRQVLM